MDVNIPAGMGDKEALGLIPSWTHGGDAARENERSKKVAPANLGGGFQLDLPDVIKFNVTRDLSAYLYDPEEEAEAAQAAVNAAKKSQAAAAD